MPEFITTIIKFCLILSLLLEVAMSSTNNTSAPFTPPDRVQIAPQAVTSSPIIPSRPTYHPSGKKMPSTVDPLDFKGCNSACAAAWFRIGSVGKNPKLCSKDFISQAHACVACTAFATDADVDRYLNNRTAAAYNEIAVQGTYCQGLANVTKFRTIGIAVIGAILGVILIGILLGILCRRRQRGLKRRKELEDADALSRPSLDLTVDLSKELSPAEILATKAFPINTNTRWKASKLRGGQGKGPELQLEGKYLPDEQMKESNSPVYDDDDRLPLLRILVTPATPVQG